MRQDGTTVTIWKNALGLRSLWRLLGHGGLIVLGVVLWFVVVALLVGGLAFVWPQILEGMLFNGVLLIGYAALALTLMAVTVCSARFLDNASPRHAGLGGPLRQSTRQWVLGASTGFGLLIPGLLVMSIGGVSFEWSQWNMSGIFNGIVVSVLLLGAATVEELLFRGYAFMWLVRTVEDGGVWVRDRVMSSVSTGPGGIRFWSQCGVGALFCLLFSVAHAGNHGTSLLALWNTFLAGVWLCIALYRSGALWYPIGLHWGWNWGQGVLFGLPVSGNGGDEDTRLVLSQCTTLRFEGPDWISGGAYGIEGSIGCSLALLLGCVIAWRIRPRTPENTAIPLRSISADRYVAQSVP